MKSEDPCYFVQPGCEPEASFFRACWDIVTGEITRHISPSRVNLVSSSALGNIYSVTWYDQLHHDQKQFDGYVAMKPSGQFQPCHSERESIDFLTTPALS